MIASTALSPATKRLLHRISIHFLPRPPKAAASSAKLFLRQLAKPKNAPACASKNPLDPNAPSPLKISPLAVTSNNRASPQPMS